MRVLFGGPVTAGHDFRPDYKGLSVFKRRCIPDLWFDVSHLSRLMHAACCVKLVLLRYMMNCCMYLDNQVLEPACVIRYPSVPVLALTATATPRVQRDVVQQLALQHCVIFRSSFNRSNLRCCAHAPPPYQ